VPDGRQESPRASGNVKRERQLVWDADLSNQRLERIAQIIERCFACLTVADGPNTWPELGRCSFRGLMRRLASSSFGADRLLRLHRRRGSVRGLAA